MIEWLLSRSFLPHQYCYRLNPSLISLHFWSDLLIGMAYVAISLTLVYMVRRGRREIPFSWMFLAFGTFIIACGATHFMEVWTLTTPVYWLAGLVKALTASASVATALALPPLVPRALGLVRSAQLSEKRHLELELANAALQSEIADRRRAEEQVRKLAGELEKRVRQRTAQLEWANKELAEKAAIVQHSQDAIFSETLDGLITSWNRGAERIFGYTSAEIAGQDASILVPKDRRPELLPVLEALRRGEEVPPLETIRLRKDGSPIDMHVAMSPVRNSDGAIGAVCVIARDVTSKRRSEEQMREAQRLESLGLIAGGVAHDFNNLLVGILGNASLALEDLRPSSPIYTLIDRVVRAGEKAAHLTQQLLAYAGKGRLVTEKLDLSELVRDIGGLIQTSIPRSVSLSHELAGDLPPVEADPGQLQQVVMNLVINGAEAIGEERGGRVLVKTGVLTAGEEELRQSFSGTNMAPGRYVTLEVHDNGAGISPEVRERIFDPFFTTKFTGRGLGLAAVLGVVRSHKGGVRVNSEPGRGSTFQVLLPAAAGSAKVPAASIDEDLQGEGVVLVIDDEETVRKTAMVALRRYGYKVLTATDGQAGVELYRQIADQVSVVLLDMTMPVMSGAETFREIRAIRPDARVILSSGYDQQEAARRFLSDGIAAFVQKPYTASKLARVLKQVLRPA